MEGREIFHVRASCHGFLFCFLVCQGQRHYVRRSYSCWCKACSRVRGQEFKLKGHKYVDSSWSTKEFVSTTGTAPSLLTCDCIVWRRIPQVSPFRNDPSADTNTSPAPAAMIINSSQLRTTDFDLREVIPLQLETVTSGGRRARGAVLKQIQGMGTRRYVLSVDNNNVFRSQCE
jgi:hypothetical protein